MAPPETTVVQYSPVTRLAFTAADQELVIPWATVKHVTLLGVTVEVTQTAGTAPEFSILLRGRDGDLPATDLLTDEPLAGLAVGRRIGWVPDAETQADPDSERLVIRARDFAGGVLTATARYTASSEASPAQGLSGTRRLYRPF